MHYYPHHIGDYRSATTHLTNEEDLAYRRMLEMYYDTEKPIPLDTQWVARRLRVGLDSVQVVLNDFFEQQEDGWHHARCDAEIKEFTKKADIARENGKKGGRRKAAQTLEKNQVGSQSVHSDNPELTQPLANQEPVTSNQEPVTSNQNNSLSTVSKPTKIDINFSYKQKHKELAQELNLAIDLERDKFIDYYLNKTNKKFLDWDAAFRNWLRNAAEFAKTAKASNRAYQHDMQELSQADEYRKQFIQIGEKGGLL